jgi:hypothetical protein
LETELLDVFRSSACFPTSSLIFFPAKLDTPLRF